MVIIGHHVLVMGVVLLRWSAVGVAGVVVVVRRRSHVTHCGNGITFELACEITYDLM